MWPFMDPYCAVCDHLRNRYTDFVDTDLFERMHWDSILFPFSVL